MIARNILFGVGGLFLFLLALWLIGERGVLLQRSTAKFLKIAGIRRILNPMGFLHGYIYGRWPSLYLNIGINHLLPRFGKRLKKWLANEYHSKVLTTDLAKSVIMLNEDIPLTDIEQIIPFEKAREIVMSAPTEIAVIDCACRQASIKAGKKKCGGPIQVCMMIGQPSVDFVIEHHPKTSRKITRQEAIDLLQAEHERGHVHTAWFKHAMNDRFYAICNCCSCCCGGIKAMVQYGVNMVASSGYVSRVDENKCVLCSTCVNACPFKAISAGENAAIVDLNKCLGCGVCVGQCKKDAMTLVRDEGKGIPLDVRMLVQKG